jgi:pimeloyl-ACP methyl ester carboxylesterase
MTDADEVFYAKLSSAAYQPQAPEEIDGYKLDRELSNKERKVFASSDGDVVIAHAGTRLKDPRQRMKDIGSDLAVTFGMERFDPRFRRAERHLKDVERKYQGRGITTVGHSLGGDLAGYTAKKSDSVQKAVTFNRGSSLFSDRGSAKARNYYAQGDLLSSVGALVNRGTNIIRRGKRKNAHSLMNFV